MQGTNGCLEGFENQGTFISLMMAYVFNARTHLSIDVAFTFFDLVVHHYPTSFCMYAEKATTDRRVLHAFESEVHEDRLALIMPTLEAQSFACVLSLLKSIDIVVNSFVNGKGKTAIYSLTTFQQNRLRVVLADVNSRVELAKKMSRLVGL
ncbi:hypothetical protein Tco_0713379 [Tanacetum coccineum]